MTFLYLLSFSLLTEAVRKNHHQRIITARVQFAPLFYSFHHPKYQRLHFRDILQRVQMPKELRNYINANESFSVSGKDNAGQGGDFVHEELDKRIKSLLPPIMPTNDIWTRVCRKLTDLEEIRDNAINIVTTKKRYENFSNEVTMLRQEIRSNFSFVNNPYTYSNVKSIEGYDLDFALVEIKYSAEENYQSYKENFFTNNSFDIKIKTPIFVTEQERIESNKIENKTKADIMMQIREFLSEIPDRDIASAKEKEIIFFF